MATILTIQYFTGSLAGRSQRLVLQDGQRMRMGRAPDADIRFSDAMDDSVSGLHAEVFLQQNRIYIEDKRSSNGTFVNGQRCAPFQAVAVGDGSRIRLGKEGPEMQLMVEAAPAQAGDPARGTAGAASTAPAAAAPPATRVSATVAGPGDGVVKQAVGRGTLLSEIDRARHEERDVVMGQLASSRRSTGVWIALGLLSVLVVAALGIGGAMYWNHRQLVRQGADSEAAIAKARQESDQRARTNIWASVEQHAAPAVVHIQCKYRVHLLKASLLRGARLIETNGEFLYDDGVQGSGVLIKPGLVLTAKHVVEPWKYKFENWSALEKKGLRSDYQLLDVQFPGQQPLKASLVASSDKYDLALLQIQPTNAPSVTIVKSNDDVKVTDRIAVIGYPSYVGQTAREVKEANGSGSKTSVVTDVTPTVVLGTVTHGLDGSNDPYSVVFDASITGGDSGGAVLNERGELIGIVGWQSLHEVTRPGGNTIAGFSYTSLEPVPGANGAMSPRAIQEFLKTFGML